MRAMTRSHFGAEAWARQPSAETRRAAGEGTVLRFAIHAVFGAPFLWCLLIASRGRFWWGSLRLFGDVGPNPALIWVVVAALGALWLGVSLMLGPSPKRRPVGALLALVGSALLVGLHP